MSAGAAARRCSRRGCTGRCASAIRNSGRLRRTWPAIQAFQVAMEIAGAAEVSGVAGRTQGELGDVDGEDAGDALDQRRNFIPGHALAEGAGGEAVGRVSWARMAACTAA